MPWPVRSRLLARYVGSPAAGTVVILGTVPAGKTWLLKDFAVYNAAASANTVTFGSRQGASHANAEALVGTPSGGLNLRSGRSLVFPAGTDLYLVASVTGQIQVHVSGAELG